GYLWVRQGLPGGSAFMAGWMDWFAHSVAGSLYALGFGAYIGLMFEEIGIGYLGLSPDNFSKVAGVIIVLIFVYINYRGASDTGAAGNLVTIGQNSIIALFILSGLYAIFKQPENMANFTPFAPNGMKGVLQAMGLTWIAFEGYEIIVQTGEEVKNPRRNIPRAIFLSLVVVVPTYILIGIVAIGALGPDVTGGAASYEWLGEHAELGLARAAEHFMPLGSVLLLLGGLFSTTSALNATTYSSTRVSFAMGRDRNLPNIFAAIHPRTRVPHMALFITAALIISMVVGAPIEDVGAAASIMFLLLFLQVNLASITIRRKYGDKLAYGYMMPYFPWLPIIAVCTQLLLAMSMFEFSPLAVYIAVGYIGLGMVVYHAYASKREREAQATPVLMEERFDADAEGFSVLVPVANPANVDNLLGVARGLLTAQEGDLRLLHVSTVPPQLPLSVGRDFVLEARPVVDGAAERAQQMGLDPAVLLRVAHRPADAIADTVHETGANYVVMGWRGRSGDARTKIGSNIDRIIHDANTNVVVVRGDVQVPAKRILIPVQHPAHGHLMAGLAARLVEPEGGYIELMHIVRSGLSPQERADRAATVRESISAFDRRVERGPGGRREVRFRIRIQEGDDVPRTILEQSRDFDLLIMGATQEGWVRRTVWGDTTSRVADQVECPLMLVNLKAGPLQFNVAHFFEFFYDVDDVDEPQ
ncbi:MAG: amino acid permease, partial [Armatimonadia bacterium]|nr:amino acid permease [Armatimonadia bacterium]